MRQFVSIGFVIPCLDEEVTIGGVVGECFKAIPSARVYVFDNNSKDRTALLAAKAGATVIASPRPGKGEVLQHAFACLNEDILIILDGDGTYPASLAPQMVETLRLEHADMVVCTRRAPKEQNSYPRFHRFGNRFFSTFVSLLLRKKISDVFSGYRAVTRDFYEGLYFESKGFEIESEMTLKAVSHGLRVKEIEGEYNERPVGSESKLRTFRDGFSILKFIFSVIKDCRPLEFFGMAAVVCILFSAWAGSAAVLDYLRYNYVYTVPRAVLAASLMVMAMLFFGIGLILDSQIKSLREQSLHMRRWMRRDEKQNAPSTHQTKAS